MSVRVGFAILVMALTLASLPAAAGHQPPGEPELIGPEHLIDRPDPDLAASLDEAIDPFAWDPLYLIGADWVRTYTLGTDTLEVWVCEPNGDPLGATVAETAAMMSAWVGSYYEEISHGRYVPEFIEGGIVVVPDSNFCMDAVLAASVTHPAESEGAIVAVAGFGSGGYASVDRACSGDTCMFPANDRIAVVGGGIAKIGYQGIPEVSTTTHELGHLLMFPHSYTGNSGSEYDNPIEIMSGNLLPGGQAISHYPYLTLAVNRYAAGWIDPDQVAVVTSPDDNRTLELVTYDVDGTQMVAMTDAPGVMVTFEARQQSAWDPIPLEYEGVAVHGVLQTQNACPPLGYGWCFGVDRRQLQAGGEPYSLDHVLNPGEYIRIGSFALEVIERTASGFVVEINGDVPRFVDVPKSHTFYHDIDWMAEEEITRGCNPPTNDRFCPTGVVTRGQMAAFMVRALGLTDRLDDPFTDDDGSTFEADIEKLAAAGITRGCNPPINDRFCPDRPVSREQMAAFMVRAFGYTDDGGGDLFDDDDDSIFERDIDRLATAGVTRGCNPPHNTRFCPERDVTRGQMAAFMKRALG